MGDAHASHSEAATAMHFLADKSSFDSKNPLHEFTNNWITRCQRNFRAFCALPHSAINKTRPGNSREPSHIHDGERGGAYHCRWIKYLDVRIRLHDVSKK